MVEMSVVLPLPENPTMATNSPASMRQIHVMQHFGARRARRRTTCTTR